MRVTLALTVVSVIGLGCGGSSVGTPTAPPTAPRRGPATAPEAIATCLPVALRSDKPRALTMFGDAPGTLLCHDVGPGPEGVYATCWRIDDNGNVYPHRVTPRRAGVGFSDSDSWDAWAVTSTDGTHRAEGVQHMATNTNTVAFFETGADEPLAKVELFADKAVSAQITAAYMVGDVLLLRDSDAGPHEDVIAYTTTGKLVGIVQQEISEGTISIADDHRVLFAHGGLTTADIYDTRTRKVASFTRAMPPTSDCTREQIDSYTTGIEDPCEDLDGDAAAKTCCAYLTREIAPYMGALAVPVAGGKLVVAKTGKHFGDIEVFELASGKRLTTNAALCPTN